jgi:uncharacterized protein YybS (DUF2232 family)
MTRSAVIGMARTALVASALFLAGCFIPIAGAFLMIFAPLPIMNYAIARPGWPIRLAGSAALATGLIMLAAGWAAGLGYAVTFGLASVIISWMIERKRPFEQIVIAASCAMLGAAVLAALAAASSPEALADALRHALAAGMAHGEDLYKTLGIENGISAEARNSVLDITVRVSPALMALSAAFAVLANLAVFWRWLNRDRIGYRLFGDLARWSTPDWLIWVLLATGFTLFVPLSAVRTAALDGFIFVAAIYFCQGLAIMAFYFKMLAMPSLARGLIYVVTGIQPVLTALVCVAGVFDMWVDFRRLKPPRHEAGNFGDFL